MNFSDHSPEGLVRWLAANKCDCDVYDFAKEVLDRLHVCELALIESRSDGDAVSRLREWIKKKTVRGSFGDREVICWRDVSVDDLDELLEVADPAREGC